MVTIQMLVTQGDAQGQKYNQAWADWTWPTSYVTLYATTSPGRVIALLWC